MKRIGKIALGIGAVLLIGGALFFANEANVFPRSARPMRTFTRAEKIWGAGGYVCARLADTPSGIRCALPGLGRDPVENAITISFLSNPSAMISDAPYVCALEREELWCWDMATPILGGLGIVYSRDQQRAGTIDHGSLSEQAAVRVPLQGAVRGLVKYHPGFCALADDGITCFKHDSAKSRAPVKLWQQKGKTMVLAAGALLCTEDGDALLCFADPSRYTTNGAAPSSVPLAMKVRVAGAAGVTAVAASYGSFCALSSGSVACAKRVNSGSSPALEELRLTRVEGLESPTKIWSAGLGIFVLDGDRIIELDDRTGHTPKVWGKVAQGEAVHADTGYDWFLERSGKLIRSPDRPWPIKYEIGGRSSQLVSFDLDTCALVDGRAMCFGY